MSGRERRFGQRIRITAGNQFEGVVCKVLDSYRQEDVDKLVLQLPDGAIMNAPVTACEVLDQEEYIYSGAGKRPATAGEVQRVRESECASRGHSWSALETWGEPMPRAFLCTNCGAQLNVVAAEGKP